METRTTCAIVGAATTAYWTWDYNATLRSKIIWTLLAGLAGGFAGNLLLSR